MTGQAEALTPALRGELADALGLPEAALTTLRIGYCESGPHGLGSCWTSPEVDAAGSVVGVSCRYRGGEKKVWPGGSRGLTVPSGWADRPGPVFLPEGPSDTLAMTALGLAAVGRPSNTGGVNHLAGLLAGSPADRPIVVVGEWDPKENGDWPGRDGATSTAAQLTEKLGRPVSWVLPPKGGKDVREWVNGQGLDRGCLDLWQEAGDQLTGHFQTNAHAATRSPEPEAAAPNGWVLPEPVDIAFLQGREKPEWVLEGFLALGAVTLVSALWKAGKSTLVSRLIRALALDEDHFASRAVRRDVKVLIWSEESEEIWVQRREELGLPADRLFYVPAPNVKLSHAEWQRACRDIARHADHLGCELIVTDTLVSCWPVQDENDASEVEMALKPMRALTGSGRRAVLVIHHVRKGGGDEGQAGRGSGNLLAFPEVLVEMRRFNPHDLDDRRRVLQTLSRFPEVPTSLTMELSADGMTFESLGSRKEVASKDLDPRVLDALPCAGDGATKEGLTRALQCRADALLAALKRLTEAGYVERSGRGKRGDPFRYWRRRLEEEVT